MKALEYMLSNEMKGEIWTSVSIDEQMDRFRKASQGFTFSDERLELSQEFSERELRIVLDFAKQMEYREVCRILLYFDIYKTLILASVSPHIAAFLYAIESPQRAFKDIHHYSNKFWWKILLNKFELSDFTFLFNLPNLSNRDKCLVGLRIIHMKPYAKIIELIKDPQHQFMNVNRQELETLYAKRYTMISDANSFSEFLKTCREIISDENIMTAHGLTLLNNPHALPSGQTYIMTLIENGARIFYKKDDRIIKSAATHIYKKEGSIFIFSKTDAGENQLWGFGKNDNGQLGLGSGYLMYPSIISIPPDSASSTREILAVRLERERFTQKTATFFFTRDDFPGSNTFEFNLFVQSEAYHAERPTSINAIKQDKDRFHKICKLAPFPLLSLNCNGNVFDHYRQMHLPIGKILEMHLVNNVYNDTWRLIGNDSTYTYTKFQSEHDRNPTQEASPSSATSYMYNPLGYLNRTFAMPNPSSSSQQHNSRL